MAGEVYTRKEIHYYLLRQRVSRTSFQVEKERSAKNVKTPELFHKDVAAPAYSLSIPIVSIILIPLLLHCIFDLIKSYFEAWS